VGHRITTVSAEHLVAPHIERDPAILASFLSDAARVPGGFADGITFPATAADVAAVVARAARVLPVGAQSSLTGGATPRGEVILSTRRLTNLTIGTDWACAGAGVPLLELQRSLAARGLYYPPVPTYLGAFVGGTIATNAAGAATFKYGSTRRWVQALTVVLATGELLRIRRGDVTASPDGRFAIEGANGVTDVMVPTYSMPDVPKLSAGYYARPAMDLIDLFIGSEGTLGVIVDATLRVVPLPRKYVVLVPCRGDLQALAVTSALRAEAQQAWRGGGPLDVAAIEYMDSRALRAVPDEAFTTAGIARPDASTVFLLLQIEVPHDDTDMLARLEAVLDACEVHGDPVIAVPGDERGARRLFELREAVPAAVNGLVGATKARVHPDIQKVGGDTIVPFERLAESLAQCRDAFERRHLDYAIWGHVSDGNLHPNVLPQSMDDVRAGREAILEIARGVMGMGGAPLAEHGVGRNGLKQQLLLELYGPDGVDQMRAVKRALDPEWKLAPGVLFPMEPASKPG
jgi:D-lactate dehydrogenase (cytochrome)